MTGWECPRCHACFAPTVAACPRCWVASMQAETPRPAVEIQTDVTDLAALAQAYRMIEQGGPV